MKTKRKRRDRQTPPPSRPPPDRIVVRFEMAGTEQEALQTLRNILALARQLHPEAFKA